ncbi:patatin-like protein [Streptomyces sp. NPDC059037]|uniref:patatin-like protein n=1 Tax=Streptomyces sp. NPDC059037 TaxID=3346710 RepID=UPI00367953E5
MTKPVPSRPVNHETRLALVLNGGVSLAVWMGGVTHELELLRRASGDASEDTTNDRDRAAFNVWKDIAHVSRTRVVIDVIAGSSAGGLNGALLATAIGRGASLPDLRKVWDESASLSKLLVPKSKTSVLSGKSFESKVRDAINSIGVGAESIRAPITLFLPATSLDGRARTYTDGFGNEFSVRDHRRLYRFQHDDKAVTYTRTNGRWHFESTPRKDFAPKYAHALTRAARATGSFPVAFPPVNETPLMDYRVHPRMTHDDPASFVMDGGVLNNAPFEPVLEAISRRTLDTPVRRVLVYVVPAAGRSQQSATEQIDEQAAWGRIAFRAANYPQEADFRSSIEDLSSRFNATGRDSHFDLFQQVSGDCRLADRLTGVAEELLDEYRHNRACGVILDIRKRLAEDTLVTSLAGTRESNPGRINSLINSLEPPNWVPLRDRRQITSPLEGQWRWGLLTATRVLQSLSHQLHHHLQEDVLTEAQQQCLIEGAEFTTERLRDVVAMLEAFESRIPLHVDPESLLSDEGAAAFVQSTFNDLDVPKRLGEIVDRAGTRFVRALRAANVNSWMQQPNDAIRACLVVEVVTRAYAPPSKVVEPIMPEFQFLRLGPDRMSRALFEERFHDMGDRKLYGIRFQHFAAFFKSDWRRSDFTWGRLDAAHHLIRLFEFNNEEERRERELELHQAILAAEAPEKSDPREWMLKNLLELAEPTDKKLMENATETSESQQVTADLFGSVFDLIGLKGRGPKWILRKFAQRFQRRAVKEYATGKSKTPAEALQASANTYKGCLIVSVILVLYALSMYFLFKYLI